MKIDGRFGFGQWDGKDGRVEHGTRSDVLPDSGGYAILSHGVLESRMDVRDG